MNVDVCGWLLGASRARGPLDGVLRWQGGCQRIDMRGAISRSARSAEVFRVLGVDVVQQQLNVPGGYRPAAL